MPTYPAGTYQGASASYLDAGGERGSVHLFGIVVTAANAVAQAAAWAAVLTAYDALALGNRIRDSYDNTTTYAVARPTNGAAREVALKIFFRDTVNGMTWDALLPTLDISLITYVENVNAKDAVDPTTAELVALSTALNEFPVVNPYAQANNVVVAGYAVSRGLK